MNEKEREILDICCTDNLEFKFEHFKNINELLEQIDKWYWNDDIEYTRWFGLNDLYILSIYISKLSEKNIKLEETKIKILESEIERLNNIINTFEDDLEREVNISEQDSMVGNYRYTVIHSTLEKMLKYFRELKESVK